nr:hypothetical protein [Xanthomonas nasturtii]WVL55619.1 hypothetical protein M3O54_014455 [Xanthomonas nasturtii]
MHRHRELAVLRVGATVLCGVAESAFWMLAGLPQVPTTQLRRLFLSRIAQAPAPRKASGACKAAHLFHTPCGWNLHKAVGKWVQAPACNAVKMGGEKMTSRERRSFFSLRRSDLDRIGKVGCAAMSWLVLRHANATY